jgi:hypothetical protein|nr:MAG TPA: hypothetical protein [Caudoviricetes sp.]
MSIKYKKDGIEINGEFLSLVTITEKCNEIKLKEDKLVILEMCWEGRGGDVTERRALPLENALKIKEILLGREVYFGEIWGKHSEVYGIMTEDTFEIEKDKKKVKEFLRNNPNGVDYNHSFIARFTDNIEERLDEDPDSLGEDEDQELCDKIYSLLR